MPSEEQRTLPFEAERMPLAERTLPFEAERMPLAQHTQWSLAQHTQSSPEQPSCCMMA